jgi:hypothetical protein
LETRFGDGIWGQDLGMGFGDWIWGEGAETGSGDGVQGWVLGMGFRFEIWGQGLGMGVLSRELGRERGEGRRNPARSST